MPKRAKPMARTGAHVVAQRRKQKARSCAPFLVKMMIAPVFTYGPINDPHHRREGEAMSSKIRVAEFLNKYRAIKDMSREDLCAQIGLTHRQLSGLERGEHSPDCEATIKIINWLFSKDTP